MPDPTGDAGPIDGLLNRPPADRLREHKYRFAQAAVFGLPVLALQYLGPRLGGPESARWVGLFQLLLAGWVLYVSSGLLFEGLLLLARRQLTGNLLVGLAAIGLYLASLLAFGAILLGRRPPCRPVFHWIILLILAWAGCQWARWSRRLRRTPGPYTPPAPPG